MRTEREIANLLEGGDWYHLGLSIVLVLNFLEAQLESLLSLVEEKEGAAAGRRLWLLVALPLAHAGCCSSPQTESTGQKSHKIVLKQALLVEG